MRRSWEILFVALLIGVFGCAVYITAPFVGLHPDEGDVGVASLDIVRQIQGNEAPSAFNRSDLRKIGGLALPVTFSDYHGAFGLYFSSVFFFLFSSAPFVFRVSFIVLGAGIIIFAYLILKDLFSRRVAALAVFLLTINPLFIQSVLVGHRSNEVFMLFFLFAAVFFFIRFFDTKKRIFLYSAFFLLGIGLSVKHMFLGFLPGLAVGICFLSQEQREKLGENLGISLVCFSAGAVAFLYDALFGRMNIVAFVRKMIGVTAEGHDNLDILGNFIERARHFSEMLQGSTYLALKDIALINIYGDKIFYLCFLILLACILLKVNHKLLHKKIFDFLICFYGMLFIGTLFVPLVLDGKHMLLFMPLPETLKALIFVLLVDFINKFSVNSYIKKSLVYFFGLLLVINITACVLNIKTQYESFKNNKTDSQFWSFCIYDAVSFMQKEGINSVYTVSHSLWPSSIAYLSEDKINTDNYKFAYFRKKAKGENLLLRDWAANNASTDFYFLSAETNQDNLVLDIWVKAGNNQKEIRSFSRGREKLVLWHISRI